MDQEEEDREDHMDQEAEDREDHTDRGKEDQEDQGDLEWEDRTGQDQDREAEDIEVLGDHRRHREEDADVAVV